MSCVALRFSSILLIHEQQHKRKITNRFHFRRKQVFLPKDKRNSRDHSNSVTDSRWYLLSLYCFWYLLRIYQTSPNGNQICICLLLVIFDTLEWKCNWREFLPLGKRFRKTITFTIEKWQKEVSQRKTTFNLSSDFSWILLNVRENLKRKQTVRRGWDWKSVSISRKERLKDKSLFQSTKEVEEKRSRRRSSALSSFLDSSASFKELMTVEADESEEVGSCSSSSESRRREFSIENKKKTESLGQEKRMSV